MMKKLMIMSVLMATTCLGVSAQKIDPSKVPATVKVNFVKQFPGMVARWEKEDGKFEAGFEKEGHAMSALFEANGTMIETEVDIKITDLPTTVPAYVKEHFKGKNIKAASKITKNNGTVSYEAEVGGKDIMFDANGKFVEVK